MITFRQRIRAAAVAAASPLGAPDRLRRRPRGSSANGTIEYWLWDSAQQPGYQKCADAFAAGRTPA